MKEAVGETSLTLITVVLVGAVITAASVVIGFLLTNQRNRANCENAGYEYKDGACKSGDEICTLTDGEYICG